MAVYFIQAGEGGQIKIGFASNPRRRISELQIGSPQPLKVLAIADGEREHERALHERFAHLRGVGEWFSPAPDLLAFISEQALTLTIALACEPEIVHPLKVWMKKTGHTLESLAKRLRDQYHFTTSANYVSQILTGYRSPGRKLSLALAEVTSGELTAWQLMSWTLDKVEAA